MYALRHWYFQFMAVWDEKEEPSMLDHDLLAEKRKGEEIDNDELDSN